MLQRLTSLRIRNLGDLDPDNRAAPTAERLGEVPAPSMPDLEEPFALEADLLAQVLADEISPPLRVLFRNVPLVALDDPFEAWVVILRLESLPLCRVHALGLARQP